MCGHCVDRACFIQVSLAKMMLSLLFVLLPLFVCFCFFESTRRVFDRYVGLLVGYAFMLVLVYGVLALGLSLLSFVMQDMTDRTALMIGFFGLVPLFLVSFIVIGLFMKSASMAYQLGSAIGAASGAFLLERLMQGGQMSMAALQTPSVVMNHHSSDAVHIDRLRASLQGRE